MKIFLQILIVLVVTTFSSISTAATITGIIKYEGEVPTFKPLKMDADPICLTKHTEPIYPDSLVLGDGNTIANVFVYVKSGLPKTQYPVSTQPVVISQQGCKYSPHVVGVMVGQPVKFLNPDGTLHNVHAICKINQEFNLAMPKFRTETTKVFDKEEFMFPVKCDVHPWMGSWISVMSHPYFATTQKDGKFEIKDLPAGTYEVEAWHEKLGTQIASLTVGADETKENNCTFSKPSK